MNLWQRIPTAGVRDGAASVYVEAAPNPDPVEGYDITVNGRQVATRDLQFFGVGERARRRPSPVVFSATDSQTLAQEQAELGHAFTFAPTQALSGGAAIEGDVIELAALMRFVPREVNRITKDAQVPEMSLSR